MSPQTVHTASRMAYASQIARNTREEYEDRRRESPLRGSPQRFEAARASFQQSNALKTYSATKSMHHSQGIRDARNSPSPRRPDSPLRQKSPRFESSAARSSFAASMEQRSPLAQQAESEHLSICAACARPCGCQCSIVCRLGQPRTVVTQQLMRNSAAKQHRQYDCVIETNYESTVRNNQAVISHRQEESSGAQFTNGVTGTAP